MEERWLRRDARPSLRLMVHSPQGDARGSVIVTTGFSETLERYAALCETWRQAGFLVVSYDLRGQGQSQGRRGYVDAFSDYVDDLLAIVAELEDQQPGFSLLGPPVAFGHSMGALITVTTALVAPARFRALLLTSPFFGLALKTPAWKLLAGRLLTRLWPTFAQPTGIVGAQLTHDAARARAIDDDPARIADMTARLFTEIEQAQAEALLHASDLELPVYCRAAGADSVADLQVTREFMRKVGSSDRQLVVVDGQFHELHQEQERDEHATLLLQQLERWCGRPETSSGSADPTL